MKTKYHCLVAIVLIANVMKAQSLYFPPIDGSSWEKISFAEANMDSTYLPALDDFVASTFGKSFIILKNGKILVESYYNGHAADKIWYWASAGKTITSFLVGKAQEDGLLDLNDYTSQYLGDDWNNCAEDSIRIIHQLTMTSGLDYTIDAYCTDPQCLECLNAPGEEWYYHNAPYTLLDPVIEAASGKNYNLFTKQELLDPTGMKGLWVKLDYNNVFWSDTRTMARFGLMMLAGGKWGTQRLINENYFEEMTNTSQDINLSYGYLWWLNGKESFRVPGTTFTFPGSIAPNAPDDMIMALGANTQTILVIPSLDMVVIRMGEEPSNDPISATFVRDVWEYIQPMLKTSNTSYEHQIEEAVDLYPNPLGDESQTLTIYGTTPQKIEIYDINGQLLSTNLGVKEIKIDDLKRGIYLAKIYKGRRVVTRKFVKY